MSILDQLSDSFSKFMTVDENDEPVISYENLPRALEEAGLPHELGAKLKSRMDPENSGYVTFENFVSVAVDVSQKEPPSYVFKLLANPQTHRLSQDSILKTAERLKIPITAQDAVKLLEMSGTTPKSFAALQRRLDNVFGPEVGAEVGDLPDT